MKGKPKVVTFKIGKPTGQKDGAKKKAVQIPTIDLTKAKA